MNFELAFHFLGTSVCVAPAALCQGNAAAHGGNAIHLVSKHRKLCKSTSCGGKPRLKPPSVSATAV